VPTVFTSVSISLDGYIAGANDGPGNELGDGGMHLHDWVVGLRSWREAHGMTGGADGPDRAYVERVRGRCGACVMGRRMFDLGERPWGEDPPFHTPVYVVTHRDREPLQREGGTTFHFVTEGVARAVELARGAAGAKDVQICGGGDVVAQCLAEGLLDELEVHVAPLFLGGGVRLFDRPDLAGVRLEPMDVAGSAAVAHLTYRVVREG
jgi:dihydrofolate reductase